MPPPTTPTARFNRAFKKLSVFAQVVFWIISMLSIYHLSWKITSQHWDKVTRDITACKIATVTILQFATIKIQTRMKVDKFTLQNRMILRVLVLAAWASAELPKVVFLQYCTITFAPGISERGPLFWAKHDRAKDNVCHWKCKCSRVRKDSDKNEKQKRQKPWYKNCQSQDNFFHWKCQHILGWKARIFFFNLYSFLWQAWASKCDLKLSEQHLHGWQWVCWHKNSNEAICENNIVCFYVASVCENGMKSCQNCSGLSSMEVGAPIWPQEVTSYQYK